MEEFETLGFSRIIEAASRMLERTDGKTTSELKDALAMMDRTYEDEISRHKEKQKPEAPQ